MPRPIDDLVRPFIHHVSPYIPGKPVEEVKRELGLPADAEIIKLASNENVLGTSPKALEVLKRAIHDVWLYPEDSCYYVRRALAEYHGVGPEHIYVGNGGVATLRDLGKLLLRPEDQAIASGPSFMKYRIVSQWAHDVPAPITEEQFLEIHTPDFSHDLEAMGQAITDRTKLVWVCSPNNPTGQTVGAAEVDRLVQVNDDRALIIMDEAYADFVEPGVDYPDTIPYVREGRHVVVMRTMAKIAGLA
ncbi:MAG TPA: aminotransferase class I/II-fold pyridoxal phosphate-dependent enzyme, partial [bacterium]|nr:aminotransferase class I/II-fold pyridoxal phosphate-dependent enzyme [bacterium]